MVSFQSTLRLEGHDAHEIRRCRKCRESTRCYCLLIKHFHSTALIPVNHRILRSVRKKKKNESCNTFRATIRQISLSANSFCNRMFRKVAVDLQITESESKVETNDGIYFSTENYLTMMSVKLLARVNLSWRQDTMSNSVTPQSPKRCTVSHCGSTLKILYNSLFSVDGKGSRHCCSRDSSLSNVLTQVRHYIK